MYPVLCETPPLRKEEYNTEEMKRGTTINCLGSKACIARLLMHACTYTSTLRLDKNAVKPDCNPRPSTICSQT